MRDNRRDLAALKAAHQRLIRKDFTLWGAQSEQVARERLGWIDLPEKSRELLPTLDALAAWSRSLGRNRFVLAGMGGSSLAPAVIAAAENRELLLLDSTHPNDLVSILAPDPASTVFVLSSKSGTTIETLSHMKAIEERLARAQLSVSEHLIVITDPGSPLSHWATERNARVFRGEPTVGGRFSALSIFGLLPAALLGVDCATLLDDGADIQKLLRDEQSENLAIALTEEILAGEPFVNLPATPLGDWIEQLIAESTGKDGVGIIPVLSEQREIGEVVQRCLSLPLGGAFYLWEWSTALLGYALGVNPFDQPDVASAKEATASALAAHAQIGSDALRSSDSLLPELTSLATSHNGYLALLCFLPMHDAKLRATINQIRSSLLLHDFRQLQVTVGFGPRYLHSTGQCHKGGPAQGAYLIITLDGLDSGEDYAIPGESYGFGELITAQALGDIKTLRSLGRKVVHAHLTLAEIEKLSRVLRAAS